MLWIQLCGAGACPNTVTGVTQGTGRDLVAKWHFSGAQPLAVASGVLTHKFHAATFWLSLVLTGRVTINCQTRRFTEPQIIKYSVASVAKFRFQFKDHQSGHHAAKALVTSFFPAERSSGAVT